jgi:hypothetical protein
MTQLIVAFRSFANAPKNGAENFGLKLFWHENDQQWVS